MILIVINGSGGVGKDHFIKQLQSISEFDIGNCSTIDIVKQEALKQGWDGVKDEKGRELLCEMKRKMKREVIINTRRMFLQNFHEGKDILFMHCREPEEIERLRKTFKHVLTLLVTNNRVEQITSNEADRSVLKMRYDFTIKNDGSEEELLEKAIKFNEYMKREVELDRNDRKGIKYYYRVTRGVYKNVVI